MQEINTELDCTEASEGPKQRNGPECLPCSCLTHTMEDRQTGNAVRLSLGRSHAVSGFIELP